MNPKKVIIHKSLILYKNKQITIQVNLISFNKVKSSKKSKWNQKQANLADSNRIIPSCTAERPPLHTWHFY